MSENTTLNASGTEVPLIFNKSEVVASLDYDASVDETTEDRPKLDIQLPVENGSPLEDHDRLPIAYARIGGVKVPFRVTAASGLWNEETKSIDVEPVVPAYINNAWYYQQALEREADPEQMYRRQKTLIESVCVALAMELQPSLHVSVAEGRVVMTNRLPRGHWYPLPDGEGIVLREDECAEFKIDSDGDLVSFVLDPYGAEYSPRVKNPISRKVQSLKKLDSFEWVNLKERFFDLDKRTLKEFEHKAVEAINADAVDAISIFKKAHDIPNVGILDSALKITELVETEELPYWERISKFYESDRAFKVLELGALGAARKTGAEVTSFSEVDLDLTRTMRPDVAPFITRTGSVSTSPAALSWLVLPEWKTKLKDIANLRLPAPLAKIVPKYTFPEDWERRDCEVIDRMRDLGLLRAFAFQHDYLPQNCYVVTLHDTKGEVVGLTNVKDAGAIEGLGFNFILIPVYDAETGIWWDPLEHMSYLSGQLMASETEDTPLKPLYSGDVVLDGVDTAITYGGEVIRYLFDHSNTEKALEDATNPARTVKVSKLIDWISAYAGRYGLIVPGSKDNPFSPSIEGLLTAVESATIDFGFWNQRKRAELWRREALKRAAIKNGQPLPTFQPMPEDWEICYGIWQDANKALEEQGIVPRLLPSSKGSKLKVRKYFMSPEGGFWPNITKACNPRRAGQILSQVSRGRQLEKMTVAVVIGETQTQTFVTPSGIEKMQVGQMFNGKASLTPGTEDDPKVLVKFSSFRGVKRAAYLGQGKRTAKIGKIVDRLGTKTVPMQTKQWRFKHMGQTTNVDLLYPIHEIADKGILALLRNGKFVDINNGEQLVSAYVVEHTFYRTTTPTENMLNRRRRRAIHGFDAHMVLDAMKRAGHKVLRGNLPDSPSILVKNDNAKFAEELRNALFSLLGEETVEAIAYETMGALSESWSNRAIHESSNDNLEVAKNLLSLLRASRKNSD